MYLSRVKLNQSAQARRALIQLTKNGAYASHQLLWRLFTYQKQRSFLFREEMEPNGLPVFYVLSTEAPLADSPVFSIEPKPFQPDLQPGDRLAYKIRVNPTVSIKSDNGKSKRHDVLMHAKCQATRTNPNVSSDLQRIMFEAGQRWFADEERLARWGFTLDAVPDVESYTQHKVVGGNGQKVQFSSVDLQGLLTVENPGRFISALATGLGKAKAFGCGLMLVRRI